MSVLVSSASSDAIPIWTASKSSWPDLRAALPAAGAAFATACGFEARAGQHCILPGADGAIVGVVFGLEEPGARLRDPFLAGRLATLLPAGLYAFQTPFQGGVEALELATVAWRLSAYRFTRYKENRSEQPRLVCPEGVDEARVRRMVDGVTMARDLVNTPANDMGPERLERAVHDLAARHGVAATSIVGDDLLAQNFPLIHAVGRAAAEAPRLVDFTWGDASAPKVTLVGKGVCFDTGGLDIKPSSAMLLMKKDMAGAATALALAHMIMDAKLNLRLRVLVPIVENAIAGSAFRPGDVYPSRKGLNVEIGNTDAEGRLILADALALAADERPDILLDFATLTGAARVALGPDLPPFYTGDDELAREIAESGARVNDPVWRLPLWEPYDQLLDGKISQLNNVSNGPFAGSITAALFLRRFVEGANSWVHFDIYGWSPKTKPGVPEGGETQTARLLYDLLERRYQR